MKKLVLFLVAVLLTLPVLADDGRVIPFEKLPQPAKVLLKKYFVDQAPLIVKADWDDFEVIYENGVKVEFDKRGEWKDFDCRYTAVPEELVPGPIKAQVTASYPGATIIKLKRDRRGYEVKLDNGLEIEFNKSFTIVDIDD